MSPTLTEAILSLVGQHVADGQFIKRDSTTQSGLAWGLPAATDDDLDHAAQMLGLAGIPFPPHAVNHTDLALSPGYAIAQLIRPGNKPMTNLGMWLTAAGSTPTGENKMFIMDENFVVLGVTADISTDLADNSKNGTWVEWPIVGGPVQGVKGSDYLVGPLCHMSINPTVAGILDGGGVALPRFKSHWPGVDFSGISTVPTVGSGFTAGSAIASPAAYFFGAS